MHRNSDLTLVKNDWGTIYSDWVFFQYITRPNGFLYFYFTVLKTAMQCDEH